MKDSQIKHHRDCISTVLGIFRNKFQIKMLVLRVTSTAFHVTQ
jgi:hypothetical protein